MPLVRAEGTILVFDKAEHHLYQNKGGGGGGGGGGERDHFCGRGTISASGFRLWGTESTSRFCPEYCMFRKLRQPLVVFVVLCLETNLCSHPL